MWWNLKSRGLSNTLLSKLSRPAGPLTSYFLATNACATIKTAKSLSFIVGTWFRRFWPRAFLFTRWDKDIGPFLNRAFFRPSQIRQVHATSTRTYHFITCTTDRTCLVRTLGFWHETKIRRLWHEAFYMVEDGARCAPSLPRVMRCVLVHPPQCKTLHVTTS